ncbi:MAG: VOC family protein [Porticoccaceae bacterium]
MNQAVNITKGIHHLGLTVRDIKQTSDFFKKQLNFIEVGGDPSYPSVFISDGTVMLTLWQAKDPDSATPFDRHHNIGLHHFALAVGDAAALEQLHRQLAGVDGVNFEFSPEPLGQTHFNHMMCTIPGGLRVEFFALH